MRKEHHAYYPDGVAAEHNKSVGHAITDLDYAVLGAPFGFYGRRVEALAELTEAIEDAQVAVKGGCTAILNVLLDDDPLAAI